MAAVCTVELIAIRPTSLDVQFVDFDGVRFHLSTPERKTCLVLSMSIRCWDELVKYGVDNVLRREYGDRVKAEVEPEYNVSLELDLETFPPDGGELTVLICSKSPLTSSRGARGTDQIHLPPEAQRPGCSL